MAISDRGFASMPKKKQREIASMGGRASGAKRSAMAANRTAGTKKGGRQSGGRS